MPVIVDYRSEGIAMATNLRDGSVADLTTTTTPRGNLAMFREVVRQLSPLNPVQLDGRRFAEVSLDGPGQTYSDHMTLEHFAVRQVTGSAVFEWDFGNRTRLAAGNWLYVPFRASFRATSGRGEGDYPCLFVVAQMVPQKRR